MSYFWQALLYKIAKISCAKFTKYTLESEVTDMKKKIFAFILTAVMLCFVLSGCSENETYSSWIENADSIALTEDVTASAAGYGIDEDTCYVKVTFTNTAGTDLGIMIEKIVINGSSEIEIGSYLYAIANGQTEQIITFEIDVEPGAVTDADIYVVVEGESAVYHLGLE